MFTDKHILVIDDSDAILMVMQSMLTRIGFKQITIMSSAPKALELLARAPDDIFMVLTDLRMPGTDGLEVLRRLGELKFSGAVAIISEMDKRIIQLAGDIAQQHKLRLMGCISKPVLLDDLVALLQKTGELLCRSGHTDAITEEQLYRTIERGGIIPYFQPKVNFRTMRVESVEALARLKLPGEINAIRPERFLPVARKAGLLSMLTEQMLTNVGKEFTAIRTLLGDGVKMSLNLSPLELQNSQLADTIERLWQRHGHNNADLILELTEEHAIKNTQQLECLNRLRLREFGVSLDDFGTGFTNIHQLRSLPYTEVKIDRTLIINIHRDTFCQAIVAGLADIARQLNIALVAEGIERTNELNYLLNKHPELVIQGYLISMPRPLATLGVWYKNWQRQFCDASAKKS